MACPKQLWITEVRRSRIGAQPAPFLVEYESAGTGAPVLVTHDFMSRRVAAAFYQTRIGPARLWQRVELSGLRIRQFVRWTWCETVVADSMGGAFDGRS